MVTDRKDHWERIYRERASRDLSWYQQEPRLSLDLMRAAGVSADDPVIDVGGGASVLVDFLLEAGFTRPAVLDISAHALAEARRRLGDAAAAVEWFEADITAFVPPHPYALWHDRAVFHFLTDESDRRRYVETLNAALPPGGHLVVAAFAVGGPERCSGLEIVQYDAEKMMSALGGGFELRQVRDEVHVTPAKAQQKFSYFLFARTA